MIVKVGNREIVIGGLGKLFYQNGLPLQISIENCKKRGLEVSLFHIADEFLKNGWKNKTVISKLRDELDRSYNLEEVINFVESDYETQRETIFQYLFGSEKNAKNWIKLSTK